MFGQIDDVMANIINLRGSRTIKRKPLGVSVGDLVFPD